MHRLLLFRQSERTSDSTGDTKLSRIRHCGRIGVMWGGQVHASGFSDVHLGGVSRCDRAEKMDAEHRPVSFRLLETTLHVVCLDASRPTPRDLQAALAGGGLVAA